MEPREIAFFERVVGALSSSALDSDLTTQLGVEFKLLGENPTTNFHQICQVFAKFGYENGQFSSAVDRNAFADALTQALSVDASTATLTMEELRGHGMDEAVMEKAVVIQFRTLNSIRPQLPYFFPEGIRDGLRSALTQLTPFPDLNFSPQSAYVVLSEFDSIESKRIILRKMYGSAATGLLFNQIWPVENLASAFALLALLSCLIYEALVFDEKDANQAFLRKAKDDASFIAKLFPGDEFFTEEAIFGAFNRVLDVRNKVTAHCIDKGTSLSPKFTEFVSNKDELIGAFKAACISAWCLSFITLNFDCLPLPGDVLVLRKRDDYRLTGSDKEEIATKLKSQHDTFLKQLGDLEVLMLKMPNGASEHHSAELLLRVADWCISNRKTPPESNGNTAMAPDIWDILLTVCTIIVYHNAKNIMRAHKILRLSPSDVPDQLKEAFQRDEGQKLYRSNFHRHLSEFSRRMQLYHHHSNANMFLLVDDVNAPHVRGGIDEKMITDDEIESVQGLIGLFLTKLERICPPSLPSVRHGHQRCLHCFAVGNIQEYSFMDVDRSDSDGYEPYMWWKDWFCPKCTFNQTFQP